MLDILQLSFWTLTYVLILFYGIKWRKSPLIFMPLLAGALNLAWELNKIVFQFMTSESLYLGCLVWLVLDIGIFILNLLYIRKAKQKSSYNIYIYIACFCGFAAAMYVLFRFPQFDGQLITSFLIDLIMAVEFVLCGKRITQHGKIPIAVTKLLGDLFAWLYYMKNSLFVMIVGVVVFLVNLFYLALCLEERAALSKKKKK